MRLTPSSIVLVAAPLVASFALAPVPADGQAPELTLTPLTGNLHVLAGAGGNIVVATGDDATFLVDDQVAPVTEQIREKVASITDRPIDFVLNTHWHHDHTGGNEALGESGAWIVAHENVRARMQIENHSDITGTKAPSPDGALPVLTFPSSMTFHLNGDTIRAFHAPHAHTDGDTIVHFVEDDVLHAGDILFNGMYPYLDVWAGGSVDGALAALEKIVEIAGDETRIVPGHGPVASRADVERNVAMIRKARAAVRTHVDAGHDLEATIAAKPLAELDEDWSWSFIDADRFVLTLWKSLTEATGTR